MPVVLSSVVSVLCLECTSIPAAKVLSGAFPRSLQVLLAGPLHCRASLQMAGKALASLP